MMSSSSSTYDAAEYKFFFFFTSVLFLLVIFLIYFEGSQHKNLKFVKQKKRQGHTMQNVAFGASSKSQMPRLRTKGEDKNFIKFKTQVEEQAHQFKDIFFLEALKTQKKVALTFDDGPDLTFTPEILEVLKSYGIKATFFLVGFKIQRHPEVVEKMLEEGHIIGNHSYSHLDFEKLSMEEMFDKQVQRNESLMRDGFDVQPIFIRPPYGKITNEQVLYLANKGYKIINWSIDTYDWQKEQTSEQIADSVMRHIHDGAIILLHSGGENKQNTVKALPDIIARIRQMGFSIVTVNELLRTPPYFDKK
ncbi:MAG: polysaccharide deacetylase family protein [Cytophagales bacterium]|nr:MAG: polysaccharide deacetylase family protein [Cytophagales bacterium]